MDKAAICKQAVDKEVIKQVMYLVATVKEVTIMFINNKVVTSDMQIIYKMVINKQLTKAINIEAPPSLLASKVLISRAMATPSIKEVQAKDNVNIFKEVYFQGQLMTRPPSPSSPPLTTPSRATTTLPMRPLSSLNT